MYTSSNESLMTFNVSLQSSGKCGLQEVHRAENFKNSAFKVSLGSYLQLTVFQWVDSCGIDDASVEYV